MTPDALFDMLGPPVLLGWALLILAPRGWPLLDAVPALVIPAGLSAVYALIALTGFSGHGGGFGSLAEVRQLLSTDWALLGGWVHYLAFDMMVGAMLAARMDGAGLTRLIQAPLLVLTFLLGPLGALLALLTEGMLRARPNPDVKEIAHVAA